MTWSEVAGRVAGSSGMVSIVCAAASPGDAANRARNSGNARVISTLERGVARPPGGGYLRTTSLHAFSTEDSMNRRLGLCLAALALASCRSYQYESKITSQDGLVPPDQFARYGHDQAEAIAIGREFGRTGADSAMAYARSLGDVANVSADSLGYRLTVLFK